MAPTAMLPGNTVAGVPIRRTSPSSWSTLISIGSPDGCWSATCWTPFERFATWTGSTSVFAQLK